MNKKTCEPLKIFQEITPKVARSKYMRQLVTYLVSRAAKNNETRIKTCQYSKPIIIIFNLPEEMLNFDYI